MPINETNVKIKAVGLLSGGLDSTLAAKVMLEQGIEMGRPSHLHITIEQSQGGISAVKVGGSAVAMGGGWFELP